MEEAQSTGQIGGISCDVRMDVSLLENCFSLVSVDVVVVVLSFGGMMFGHADSGGLS